MTSKSRGYKLAILFVHFLLQDTGLVRQVNILINPETKTEEAIIMVCEHIKKYPSMIRKSIYQSVWSAGGWWYSIHLKELEVLFESRWIQSNITL